jgi:hypothetical protein
MGTNFYLGKKPCDKCGLTPDKIHLGKRSGGWRFLVRGYRNNELGNPISSYREMLSMVDSMRESGWTVFDEYGKEYPGHDFEAEVEGTRTWRSKPTGCHYTALKKEGYDMSNDALDNEGWSVIFREFS